MSRATVLILCLAGYATLCLGIAVWSWRRTRGPQSFYLANRELGPWVASLAMFASLLSGVAFVAGPGSVYKHGLSTGWIIITSVIGTTLSYALLGKRLRGLSEVAHCLSLPEVIGIRYRCRFSRGLTALVVLTGVLGYLSVQIGAMKIAVGIVGEQVFDTAISPMFGLGLTLTIVLAYSVCGGMLASAYTDFIQGLIMIIAALLVTWSAISLFPGGLAEAIDIVESDSPGALGPFGSLSPWTCLSFYFLYGLGTCGQPHVINKLMMCRSLSDLRTMLPVTLIAGIIGSAIWLVVGVVMRAQVIDGAVPDLARADQAAPAFLAFAASPFVAGVVFAGLFAAIMSTVDSFLNIGAAALVYDLPASFGVKMKEKTALFLARIATFSLVFLAAFIAHIWDRLLLFLGMSAWAVFAAFLVPLLGLGLNWKRGSRDAARVTLVVGILGLIAVKTEWIVPPLGISSGAVLLLTTLVTFIVVSWFRPETSLQESTRRVMDL